MKVGSWDYTLSPKSWSWATRKAGPGESVINRAFSAAEFVYGNISSEIKTYLLG